MASRVSDPAALLTPSLLLLTARLGGELLDAIERARDVRWWAQQLRTRAGSSWRRPMRGGAPDDDAAVLVGIITGGFLCRECIAHRTGIPIAHVDGLLTTVASTRPLSVATRTCTACLEARTTYGLNGAPGATERSSGMRPTLSEFLSSHPARAFCAECLATTLFPPGKNINVALRLLEGNGVQRRTGHCSACGKASLVASMPAPS